MAWHQEELPRGAFLGKLTEVRLLIEPASAELAARRGRPEDRDALHAAFRDMRDALYRSPPAPHPYNQSDLRFHRAIFQACQNDILEQMGAIVNRTLLVAF